MGVIEFNQLSLDISVGLALVEFGELGVGSSALEINGVNILLSAMVVAIKNVLDMMNYPYFVSQLNIRTHIPNLPKKNINISI
jgi:hypothetical protein